MSNPQEIKKAILANLAEKGDYKTILENLDDDDESRNSVLAVLAEKGDYTSVLKGLNNSNKKKQTQEAFEKLSPLFELSEMITKEAKGVFMGDLSKQLDTSSSKKFEELTQSVQEAKNTLQNELQSLLNTTKSELVAEHLSRYQEAETALSSKLMQLAVNVVSAKANELLPSLAQGAKLTEEEIEDIIEASALSVESQMAGIVGEYIAEHKFLVSQIEGFAEAVRQLLPAERQISWNDIANKPEISQGGTNANLVRQMIDAALANFSGGSGGHTIEDEGTPLTQRDTLNFTGAGVTVTDAGGKTVVTISSGDGVTVETPTGSVNSTNNTFTVSSPPKWVVSDGITYFDGFGYTLATLTLTLDVPPSQYIRAII